MYSPEKTAELIKGLARVRNLSIQGLLEQCGMNKNGLFMMTNRGSMPRADNLAKLADALSCSVDYLLGRTEVVEVGQTVTVPLAEDEALLLDRYSRLDPDRKEIVRARALELVLGLDGGEGSVATKKPAPDSTDAGLAFIG